MNKISCDICNDLIPLVKDGVASTESERVVFEHLKDCPDCSTSFSLSQKPIMNDKKVFRQIKKQITLPIAVLTVLSVLFGIGLTMSENMFYNIIIMPLTGLTGYFILKNKSYIINCFVFAASYIWHLIIFYIESGARDLSIILVAPLTWSIIYSGLSALGTLIGFLLHFAFKRED